MSLTNEVRRTRIKIIPFINPMSLTDEVADAQNPNWGCGIYLQCSMWTILVLVCLVLLKPLIDH